jgi:hypothetical protein
MCELFFFTVVAHNSIGHEAHVQDCIVLYLEGGMNERNELIGQYEYYYNCKINISLENENRQNNILKDIYRECIESYTTSSPLPTIASVGKIGTCNGKPAQVFYKCCLKRRLLLSTSIRMTSLAL